MIKESLHLLVPDEQYQDKSDFANPIMGSSYKFVREGVNIRERVNIVHGSVLHTTNCTKQELVHMVGLVDKCENPSSSSKFSQICFGKIEICAKVTLTNGA